MERLDDEMASPITDPGLEVAVFFSSCEGILGSGRGELGAEEAGVDDTEDGAES